jgi:hypothetical protein
VGESVWRHTVKGCGGSGGEKVMVVAIDYRGCATRMAHALSDTTTGHDTVGACTERASASVPVAHSLHDIEHEVVEGELVAAGE